MVQIHQEFCRWLPERKTLPFALLMFSGRRRYQCRMVTRRRSNSSWTFGIKKPKLHSPFSYLHKSTMPEFSNAKLRLVYVPELRKSFPRDLARMSSGSLPSLQQDKMKCPDCGEVTELYDYLIDKILQAPESGIPSVEVLSISPRDPNPDPHARSNYWHMVWSCREARYRTTY